MIRRITKQDRDSYIGMAKEFYTTDAVLHNIPEKHFEDTFEELMRSDQYTIAYIFENNSEIAGYALLAKTFSQEAGGVVLWIEELYVLEQYRNAGIGKEFFDYLEESREPGVKRIRLEVEDYNEKAIRLYSKMGFIPLEYSQMIKEY